MTIPIHTSTFLTDRTSNSFTITAEDGSDKHVPASREIRINYDNVNRTYLPVRWCYSYQELERKL